MNTVFLIGRLTKDPEIRVTTSGKKVASFGIAVDDGKDRNGQSLVQYFNISVWEKQAEIIESFVKKGHQIAITGSIKNRSWTAADGTTRRSVEIQGRQIQLLTTKYEAEKINTQNSSGGSANSQNSGNNSNNSVNNPEDLPEINVEDIQTPF